MNFLLNVVWIVLCGCWLARVLLAITIIGIRRPMANFRLVPVALVPSRHEIVGTDEVAVSY